MKNYKFIFLNLIFISCIIDVNIPAGISTLKALIWDAEGICVRRVEGGGAGGPYYGSLAGLRALSDTNVKTAYISDYGTGVFVQDRVDNSSADNTWQTIAAASGKRYKRQWDGLHLQVEWFGVKGDGITDNTDSLQKAVNAAYKKELVFDKSGFYLWNRVNIPSGIKINGNGCRIAPVNDYTNDAMFNIEIVRNNASTGLYAGGSRQEVFKPDIKNVSDIEISGFNADLQTTRKSFFDLKGTFSPNTVVNKVWIHHNNIRNFAVNAINFATENRPVDSTCIIRQIQIEHNDIRYNGMVGLAVSENKYTGDTVITVNTIDKNAIASRLKNAVGKYFWFGSPIISTDTLDNTGFNTTNTYFRLRSYRINPDDSSRADIKVEGGSYDVRNGWIKNTDNPGLRARIARYNMVIPIDPQSGPLLFASPQFTAAAGATTLTRTNASALQDAYHRNLVAGMRCSTNDGFSGCYTITGVTANTITIMPALTHAIAGVNLLLLTGFADCIAIAANVQECLIENNSGYGANHFVGMQGIAPRKKWAEESSGRYYINNNIWYYMWMGVEDPASTSRVTGYVPFSTIAVKKGDTSFAPSVSSRIGAKDMGSGIIKYMTAATTANADVTIENSYFVGDIIAWPGEHYRMIIRDFYLAGGNPTVSLRRFDTYKKVALDSGFSATVSNLKSCYRLYNREYGETGMPRYLSFKNNYGYYTVRNAGGSGYHISCLAYDMDIINNHFYNSENSSIEVHAVHLNIDSNWFYNYVFDGTEPRLSLTKRNNTAGISHKGWGAVIGSSVEVRNNHFLGEQPATKDYDFRTGSLLLQPNVLVLHPMEKFSYVNNSVSGFTNTLFSAVDFNIINGLNYVSFYYDLFEVKDNTISATKSFSNYGWANYTLNNRALILRNNTITVDKTINVLNVFATNDKPNPELFDSTKPYQITIANNYNTTARLNSSFLEGHAGVSWKDNIHLEQK